MSNQISSGHAASPVLEALYAKAKAHPKRIAFADGSAQEVIAAARIFADSGFGTPVLVGSKAEIETIANLQDISLEGIEIFSLPSPHAEPFALEYAKLREKKGVTLEQAREKMMQPHYLAIMGLAHGMFDGVVSGFSSATKPFIPAFEIIKTAPGIQKASSFFLMTRAESAFLFADCGLQINPSSSDLAEIGIVTAQSAKFLGFSPKVAFLSFSTKGSAKGPEVEKVQQAVIQARTLAERLHILVPIEGEMQFDAAILPAVCAKKFPSSTIKGDANVLVFPNLDAGNIAYKITERLAGFHAVGPLLQGLNKPVQDLSRGARKEDIVDSAVICVLESQGAH